jgi:DNA-binding transcriptional LysR family regulator
MAQMRALIAVADHGSYSATKRGNRPSRTAPRSPIWRWHCVGGWWNGAVRRALTEQGRRTARAASVWRRTAGRLAELENLLGRETGRIVIGAMPLSRARILPAAAARFLRGHPDNDHRGIVGRIPRADRTAARRGDWPDGGRIA